MNLETTITEEGFAEHQRMLEELSEKFREQSTFLIAVSDIYSEEAELSLDRAQAIPLQRSSIERRNQGERRIQHRAAASGKPFASSTGLREALTRTWFERSPVALREITANNTLLWGTKRWVTHATYHMQIAAETHGGAGTRWMVARIDFLTGVSRADIEERTDHAGREWIAERLEKANAPLDWIRAALGDDVL